VNDADFKPGAFSDIENLAKEVSLHSSKYGISMLSSIITEYGCEG
jgi:hypothetical protein